MMAILPLTTGLSFISKAPLPLIGMAGFDADMRDWRYFS